MNAHEIAKISESFSIFIGSLISAGLMLRYCKSLMKKIIIIIRGEYREYIIPIFALTIAWDLTRLSFFFFFLTILLKLMKNYS